VNRDDYPCCITADAYQLHKVLSTFQSTLDEITLVAWPEKTAHNLQAIQMVSYVSAAKGALTRLSAATKPRPHQCRSVQHQTYTAVCL
jgi:hypothetical protein